MNIGDVSARSGLPSKTIRYYEEIGLVKPARDPNGYRSFSDANVHVLTFVAHARTLGFSIDDCRQLVALWENQARASSDVRALAQSHLHQIETKIADLEAMRDTLSGLVRDCAGNNRPDCPILERLADQS
jgi:Cu(I)-responsive transcriptional regulator